MDPSDALKILAIYDVAQDTLDQINKIRQAALADVYRAGGALGDGRTVARGKGDSFRVIGRIHKAG